MRKNIIQLLMIIICLNLLFSCEMKTNNNATSDEELQKAANELAELSCQTKYASGEELDKLNLKGEALANMIGETYLHSNEDSTKFMDFLFQAQEKICGDK
jgi:hypothetical protein